MLTTKSTTKRLALYSLMGAGLAVVGYLAGCHRGASTRPVTRQVVVLGFDGADPKLASQWMAEGKLPNLARLAREGTFKPLGTTNPPESPVAWASFATGLNPGGTGIFDFLKRDPETYLPELSLVSRERPKFLWGLIPIKAPKVTNLRSGVPFYKAAADAGYKTTIIRMPLEFPPTAVPGGKLWAGLGVPDLRGTWGTFFYFSSDLTRWDVGDTEFGGKLVQLELFGNHAATTIEGPMDPTSDKSTRLSVPIEFNVTPDGKAVTLTLQEQTSTLGERQWSEWFHARFRVTPFLSLSSICRFYILQASPDLRVYMSALNLDPEDSPLPLSSPSGYTAELAKKHGLMKTLGWWHDTWALNEERIDEGVFLEDCWRTMQQEREILLDELRNDPPSLLVSIFTATDSVSHMFYRLIDPKHPRYDPKLAAQYGDAIEQTYVRMDAIVGDVMRTMRPDGTLIIVSDHGFHAWRKGFNTNTWLVKSGFMTLKNPGAEEKPYNLDNLFGQGSFFPNTDWSRTQAYALGLGQVYLNLRGREKYGIVNAGADAQRILEDLRRKLLALEDPDTHERVIESVYLGSEIFHGARTSEAPDLQMSFRDGYRTSWQTSLGAVPAGIIVANMKKWSGDHCASDPSDTQGIFFSNRQFPASPSILDISPTVLGLLGVEAPAKLDGHVLSPQ
ncbi:MAG: alkaline phosphatase family protein [Terriglobia bacterium]|jgi:predicted AlkP superfamily phosphohydrolase/phosphomutase